MIYVILLLSWIVVVYITTKMFGLHGDTVSDKSVDVVLGTFVWVALIFLGMGDVA